MKQRSSFLAISLALGLAACGSAPQTPSHNAAAPGVAGSGVAGSGQSVAQRLGRTTLAQAGALPDVAALRRDAGDASPSRDLIIGYRDEAAARQLAAHLGARVKGNIPELRTMLLELPASMSVDKARLALAMGAGGARYAARNDVARELGAVTKAGAASSGAVQAQAVTDPLAVKQWWIRQIGADQVRGVATGKGVIVGVVDDDFDRLHEDLKASGKIVTGLDTTDVSKENLLPPDAPLTSGDHGSGSAGTIAERLNDVGGAGVAPDATLMPIRIFNPKGYTGDFNVAYGVVWAVNHGAKVLNNSWGGGGYGQVLKDAFDYALSKNVVVVGSAGNDHRDLHNGIENFPGVISVGASIGDDRKADFSNTGPRVDVFAPGDNGLTTFIDETLKSPERESSYGLFNGTSMAGPVVAGGAALVLERAAQLGVTLTPYQVKRILADTGDLMNDPRVADIRRLNLVNALKFTPASLPADGGSVVVGVTDLVEGAPIDGTDVILSPLGGQNKGLDYLAQTSAGRLDKGKTAGLAYFYGIEPGEYEVRVAGPGAFGYQGTRTTLLGRVTVVSGQQAQQSYQHQVDFYEYTSKGRNGAPASATDLTTVPASVFAGGPIFGGSFDNDYTEPAYPKAPAGTPDEDFYKVNVPAGQTLTVNVYASQIGSNAVGRVDLVNASNALIKAGSAGDPKVGDDATVSYTATAATTLYVKLSEANKQAGAGYWYAAQIQVK